MIDIEAGSTMIRWKLSRCMPSASARIALIESPCETAAQTASSPCSARRSRRPSAGWPATARADISRHRLAAGEAYGGGLVSGPSSRASPCSGRAAPCRSTRRSRTRSGPARSAIGEAVGAGRPAAPGGLAAAAQRRG